MAYSDDVIALSPNHYWSFDGSSSDSIGAANGVETSISSGAAIAEDAANSRFTNGTGDRISLPSTTTINNSAQSVKAMGGWFMLTSIQTPPKRIYGEGTQNPVFQFMCAYGNNVMFEVAGAGFVQQIYGLALQPNRAYHLFGVFDGANNQIKFYIDGLEVALAEPANKQPNTATLSVRGVGQFGDPSGASGVGGGSVLLNASQNGHLQHWASWDGSYPTDVQIRGILFEKGALPETIISSNSLTNMQAAVNALSGTSYTDKPLIIRVEALSGGGDMLLNFDNITFDDKSSIHVQYMGSDTLSIVNLNGSNTSIVSTPNGGNVNVINPSILTVQPLQVGTEVRLLESGTTNEIGGIESSGASYSITVQASSIDVVIHALGYLNIKEKNIDMTGGDLTLPVEQVIDRQYVNN